MASLRLLSREVLSAALAHRGMAVVACVGCDEARTAVDSTPADILVFDTTDGDSDDVARFIHSVRRAAGELPVLVVVDDKDDGILFTALDAGAGAVVHRGQPLTQLVYAIESAVQRQSILSPTLATKVLARMRSMGGGAVRFERAGLSARETAVLGGVARGMTNEQIARETAVSPSTVKNQLYSACRKLGVSSRSHAVAEAIRRGIIAPSGEPIPAS